MRGEIDTAVLEAYSRGEITRREIEEQSGQTLSFGALLMLLHEHHLPLPRFPTNPQSPGVQLIKRLVEKRSRV